MEVKFTDILMLLCVILMVGASGTELLMVLNGYNPPSANRLADILLVMMVYILFIEIKTSAMNSDSSGSGSQED